MPELLAAYPITLAIRVAWGDMDAFQHVNNTIYFRYFESARIAYLERLGVADFIATSGVGPILHSVNCRFRLPVTYPDTVHVGVRVTALGADRMVMDQCLVSERHGKIAAQGNAITVTYDYGRGVKAPLPTVVRNAIFDLEAQVGNVVGLLDPVQTP
ncbi:MAG: acyl-CoA thioesterase [Caldilineaceae bacterium]|nr:acyl-CoA thioesterase [Caldilineaceae bacterium]